jgi:hypothetical protein
MFSGCNLMPPDLYQTPSPIVTEISTEVPTGTPTPTATLMPTSTPTPPPVVYSPQEGTPAYIANFARPAKGCNWLGVAGQVFGPDGLPVLNLIVSVKGKLGATEVDVFSMTGLPQGDPYGPGGYEIKLADQTSSTNDSLTIQVFDLQAMPLSSPLSFNTFSECDKNLVIINFTTDEN